MTHQQANNFAIDILLGYYQPVFETTAFQALLLGRGHGLVAASSFKKDWTLPPSTSKAYLLHPEAVVGPCLTDNLLADLASLKQARSVIYFIPAYPTGWLLSKVLEVAKKLNLTLIFKSDLDQLQLGLEVSKHEEELSAKQQLIAGFSGQAKLNYQLRVRELDRSLARVKDLLSQYRTSCRFLEKNLADSFGFQEENLMVHHQLEQALAELNLSLGDCQLCPYPDQANWQVVIHPETKIALLVVEDQTIRAVNRTDHQAIKTLGLTAPQILC